MSALDNIAKTLGDAVGIVGGGPSQVKAGLAFASFRQKLLDQTKRLGATLGSSTGSDFAASFAAGAVPAASSARADALGSLTGITADPRKLALIAGAGVLALLAWLAWRKS